MKTWAAVSASTWRDYNFSLPLSALFWREIGIEPLCLLVGDWDLSARTKIARDAIKELEFETVQIVAPMPPYEESTVAQNVRQHAGTILKLNDDDWLMPSDADLWPLRKEFYRQHETNGKRATCLYSNGDHFQGKADVLSKKAEGTPFQTIPTCHAVMRVSDWRERYGLDNISISYCTKRTLDGWLKPKLEGKTPSQAAWESWMSDQRILTEKLCEAPWFPADVAMIERRGHPPVDRLDRNNWSENFATATDAHIFKAPDSYANWSKLRNVIAHFLPRWIGWAEDYWTRYRGSYVD